MTVTEHQIRHAMAIIAHAIDTRPEGAKYWPIFERLERELACRIDRDARLKAALAYEPPEDEATETKRRSPKKRTVNPPYAALYASWDEENKKSSLD